MEDQQDHPTSTADLLSQLLAALATGARAVQGLPLGDEFEYQSSFPEFRQLIGECHEGLGDTILIAIVLASIPTSQEILQYWIDLN